MPTGASSTERASVLRRLARDESRAVADVGHLLRFRAGTLRRGRVAAVASAFAVLTVGSVLLPTALPGSGRHTGRALDVLTLLPTAYAAFLLLAIVSGVASGGGRELVPREQAVAYPISPTTDHLGALLLAPLNIAWLLQSWTLLGATAYGVGWSHRLLPAAVAALLWILAATAAGQAVAWGVEGVRRLRHGIAGVRLLGVAAVVAAATLQLTHTLAPALDSVPTRWLVIRTLWGLDSRWVAAVGVEAGLLLAAVVAGAVPAHLAHRLMPGDEQRSDGGVHTPAPLPSGDLAMLLRIDRASVWRSVPVRRGVAILAVGPGLVALAGALSWTDLLILPGLVVSGGTLLFGVNVWCLDGRGGLWRESLPVAPAAVFLARVIVLGEFLLAASGVTLVLGALRAGVPTATELCATLAVWLVVTGQVVGASLRWSQRSPYALDLRSARATPAPPLAMVGYSTRLALTTTLTSVVFQLLAHGHDWRLPLVFAATCWCWTGLRLLRARDAWVDPAARARVVTTVAL